jgi:hypothetical protein
MLRDSGQPLIQEEFKAILVGADEEVATLKVAASVVQPALSQ